MTSEATTPDSVDLLGRVTSRVKEVVAGVQQSQLDAPTPCAEWNVHGLINHLIGGLEFTAGTMAGNPPNIRITEADSSYIAEQDAAVLIQAYHSEVDRILESASEPGAMERIVPTPSFGAMPIGRFLLGTLLDQFIHGWDLAKATGQDTTLAPDVVEFAYALLSSGWADQGRAVGFIGPALAAPDDASLQDRLIAYMGRQP